MAQIIIDNVDTTLLVKQVSSLYDMAHRERQKATEKNDPVRAERAANLDALLDMLSDASVKA